MIVIEIESSISPTQLPVGEIECPPHLQTALGIIEVSTVRLLIAVETPFVREPPSREVCLEVVALCS